MPYYPAGTVNEVCEACYASESSCKPDFGSSTESTYCGNCNVQCNTSQSFCSIGIQNISSHGNVGSFSGFGATSDNLIFEKWTASKWNELQQLYEIANGLGIKQNQGASFSFTRAAADPCNNTHPANSLITAEKYNEFSTAAEKFGSYIPTVTGGPSGTVITAGHSTNLENGFSNAKFNTSVCDICNAGTEHNCGYNCSCNYNCGYNCNYNCCNHNCNKNETSDAGGAK
ncbi:MAG: hypothetical protein E7167_02190 [Firmicutes bacterium]|nr:hypothetical protein [Bacillota bacterium]